MSRDKRIDQLTAAMPVISDLLGFYDVSNPGTKKMTIQQLADLLAPAASLVTIYETAGTGSTITLPVLIGKSIKLLLRGGIGGDEIITDPDLLATPTPTINQIFFFSTTGNLTAGNPWAGERVTIQYS